ncbi:type II toxin-antitoxin system RelE/ParE family toxin [Escherichia coli]|uniref:type II toxin-antitoxin system RelE/ParE family toxin n=1 Tax=Escherichia coli TaxID=562 RepID=UPI0040683F70
MELKWTSKALSDLSRLFDFLVLASKPAAARTVQSLTQAPVILLTHPRMENSCFSLNSVEVRIDFAYEYEIRYEINGQTIYVLRVWWARHTRKTGRSVWGQLNIACRY